MISKEDVDKRIEQLRAMRRDLICGLVDYRISKGVYKPEEREQRYAEIDAALELVEGKVFDTEFKQH